MNRKILIAVFVISLSIVMTVAAFAPALARKKIDEGAIVSTGQHGEVILQLPAGVPSHPTCLRLVADDHDRKSAFGAGDSMTVALWIPQYNGFMPVALISDNDDPELFVSMKKIFNNSFIWNPIMPNILNVTDQDLDVWSKHDVLFANLTKSMKITLPFNLMVGTPYAAWGNLTFTLPPLTLTFRPIAKGFHFEESLTLLPHPPLSGYSIEVTSWQTPAWVTAEIPSWLRTAWLEASGHICTHLTSTFTPPAA